MLSDDQLIAYLSGALPSEERARVEAELAGDAEALRRLLDQERLDASLKLLLNPGAGRERLKASVLAGIRTPAHEVSAEAVMKQVLLESGKNALAYRTDVEERGPGLVAVLCAAFAEWIRTTHGRIAFAAASLALLVFIGLQFSARRAKPTELAHQPPPVVAATNVVPVSVPTPVPNTRDLARWPFAASSVWNTAIGSGAQFAAVQAGGMDPSTGVMVVDAAYSHPVLHATISDPLGNLYVADATTPFATVPVPTVLANATGGRHVFLILPDGFTLLEIHSPRRAGADVHANAIVRADLRGSGIPPEYRAANGSGLTPLGGSIRRGELKTGIPHVVGAVVPLEAVTVKADGTAHVWPAGWSQAGDPGTAAKMAHAGNVHVGSLLAIPPGVDLAKFLAPGSPAYEVARAMQDYGVLVKDTFDGTYFAEWQREGGPHLIICVEDLFNGEAPRDLARQLAPVIRELRVVANHGPNSIGGGGTPRRPAAPAAGKP